MTRHQIYDYFFIALLLAALAGVALVFSPFLGALSAAFVCALTFYPMYKSFGLWWPRSSVLFRAALADVLVFLFVVTPILVFAWTVVQESNDLLPILKQGRTTVDQIRRDGDIPTAASLVVPVRSFLAKSFGISHDEFRRQVVGGIDRGLQYFTGFGTAFAANFFGFLIGLVVMFFSLFFMFRDGERFYESIVRLVPLRQENKDMLAQRVRDTMVGVARGWLLACLLQGVLAALGYLIIRADGALILGMLSALIGLVPVVGTFGVWIPVGVFYLVKGAYLKAIFVFGWNAVIVVALVDTVIRPYLVGKRAELPLFALFFALLGGIEIWGAKGVILGPLLVAIAPVLLEIYRERFIRDPNQF